MVRRTALALAVLLAAAACGSGATVELASPRGGRPVSPEEPSGPAEGSGPEEGSEGARRNLAAARDRWAATGLTDYDYSYRPICECNPDEVTVSVRAGQPASAQGWTVEALFDWVEATLDDGKRVDVSYDAFDGHPTALSLDLDAMAADGGFGLTVTRFGPPPPVSGIAGLDAAKRRWGANRPTRYRMTYTVQCFCPRTSVTVTVNGATITETVADREFAGVVPDQGLTVDALFDLLAAAEAEGAASIQAEFDPTDGHPTHLWVDRDERLADEEIGYQVTAFEPLP